MALDLKAFTPARVGQGVTTREWLALQLDHARARDAVHFEVDPAAIALPHVVVRSKARNRQEYLRRPDLGRALAESVLARGDYDAAIVVADGLSAPAVHHHAMPFLEILLPHLVEWKLAPLTVALQARVALGDEIGEALGARMTVMLIGERPGLTAPDRLGIYLTWNPRRGRTDAERNCISNVQGLGYEVAAQKLLWLMEASRTRRISGVALKECEPSSSVQTVARAIRSR